MQYFTMAQRGFQGHFLSNDLRFISTYRQQKRALLCMLERSLYGMAQEGVAVFTETQGRVVKFLDVYGKAHDTLFIRTMVAVKEVS